nr:hypothetical protein [Tanacetum cinerariifolium]
TEDMQKRRNDVKARTTLLLALPDKHQLRFSKYETAQELWEAILKTFEVQKKSESNSQKIAFISSSNTSSGNGEVHTASVSTACTEVSSASTDVAAASLSHDTVCAYIASQSNGHFARECRAPRSQDRGKRESYRQAPKEEEPTPKALMAIDGIRWDWSYMADEEENHAIAADDEVPTEFALMAKSSSSSENENKEGLRYNVVPPPPAQVYSYPKKDLSWTGLPEFVDDTITD